MLLTVRLQLGIVALTVATRTKRLRYDVDRFHADMALRGWNARQLSRVAGVNVGTTSLFLSGKIQTATTAQKLAHALGYTPKRYFVGVESAA